MKDKMNKRIRELVRESNLDVYGLGKERYKWEYTVEKFAELLIKECAEVASDTMYKCDNWVIVKSPSETDPHYRVLVGTSGGYLDGDSWRMNSGIVKVDESDDYFYFYGSSGSCYQCHKDSYTVRMNIAGTLAQLKELGWELMDEDTDFMNMDWIIK